jgi:hypothetical protein
MQEILERNRRRWEDNIKMHLKEMDCDCVEWALLGQFKVHRRALAITIMRYGVA